VSTPTPLAATGRPRIQTWVERLTIWRAVRTIAVVVVALVLVGAFLVRVLEPKTFDDFGLSAWWAVTTVSTVGYGDIVPVTTQGRIVGTVLMITGVSLIPLVTSVVVSILAAKRAEAESRDEARQIEALTAQLARIEEQLKR
jgi:voltage-gated potassium channel